MLIEEDKQDDTFFDQYSTVQLIVYLLLPLEAQLILLFRSGVLLSLSFYSPPSTRAMIYYKHWQSILFVLSFPFSNECHLFIFRWSSASLLLSPSASFLLLDSNNNPSISNSLFSQCSQLSNFILFYSVGGESIVISSPFHSLHL